MVVRDQAVVAQNAWVSGNSVIEGHAMIKGHAEVIDSVVKDAVVTGAARIQDAQIYGGHWDGAVVTGGSWLAPEVPT